MAGLITVATMVSAQQPGLRSFGTGEDPSYFEVMEAAEAWFEANPGVEAEEGGLSNEFARWELFWRLRIANDQGQPGSIAPYAEALAAYSTLPICANGGINTEPWTEHGPIGDVNGEPDQGMMRAVETDPSDPEVAFIGAASGGIGAPRTCSVGIPNGRMSRMACICLAFGSMGSPFHPSTRTSFMLPPAMDGTPPGLVWASSYRRTMA